MGEPPKVLPIYAVYFYYCANKECKFYLHWVKIAALCNKLLCGSPVGNM